MTLATLHIKNVVLIEQLALDFPTGLSALTGETGAGKSILLDSLSLAAGDRADSGLVRHGTDQASVSATFDLPPDHPVFALLTEQGFTFEAPIILRRLVNADGRSRAFINDETVSVGLLKEVGALLVDIHGQFETYGLLNPATHRTVLDDYAGLSGAAADVARHFSAWKKAERDVVVLTAELEQARQNEAWLRDSVEELSALKPEDGEETRLLEGKKKLQNMAALQECLTFAEEAIGGEQGADMLIGQTMRSLHRNRDKIGAEDTDPLLEDLEAAAAALQSASRKLSDITGRLDPDGLNMDAIEDRLYALRGAARKHRCTPDELPARLSDMRGRLDDLSGQDNSLARLEKECAARRTTYQEAARALHEARSTAAITLDARVNAELPPLKLEKSAFRTDITLRDNPADWGADGMDDIRFLVATNLSEAARFAALDKVASGGEMARFMLALKVVLAESAAHRGVFVFDEIDTGIGGATANAVGERLARLAQRHQVLVVTHSPQVAALAAHHWQVSKAEGQTRVLPLDGTARREEIARMLSGAAVTEEARAAADRLLGGQKP